ncbi:glycosyltransferase [Flavobacterium agricola]|uniref:Glycosyltransferase n=1 Tax=Flavobacterium agricola TaxID=2870839 RepID=A0ABY6LX91_9FLAO|nr:glycosyltransferase [Flavobacterium agricola]UYW00963.1 glycosyltransferase [Flavobacterium agricola]
MNKTVVLIPHYNNNFGLKKAIEAIGKNEKVDVLVVDDGSFKNKINEVELKKAINFSGSISFLYLEQNSGIEIALNEGLKSIYDQNKYKYIARLDCDDICIDTRFKIQEEYLDKNKDTYLVGSNATAINEVGECLFNTKFPEKYKDIKNKMHVNSMHLHPCVMFRIEILETIGYYPINYQAAEDYAYFFDIVKKYKTYNIKESLVYFQVDNTGISAKKRTIQIKSRIRIMLKHFYWGFWPIYGLVRSCGLLIIPNKLIKNVKKIIYSK